MSFPATLCNTISLTYGYAAVVRAACELRASGKEIARNLSIRNVTCRFITWTNSFCTSPHWHDHYGISHVGNNVFSRRAIFHYATLSIEWLLFPFWKENIIARWQCMSSSGTRRTTVLQHDRFQMGYVLYTHFNFQFPVGSKRKSSQCLEKL